MAAFRVGETELAPEHKNYHPGQLVFLCPFCGDLHFHGAVGPKFGAGNGHRVEHCWIDNAFNHFGYCLREVDNPFQAGTLPKKIVQDYHLRAARRAATRSK